MPSSRPPRSARERLIRDMLSRDRRALRDPARRERLRLLLGGGLAATLATGAWMKLGPGGELWPSARAAATHTGPHGFAVQVNTASPGKPIAAGLLGHNVQWVDRGDDLLQPDGRLRPEMLEAVKSLQPAVLRFPGGAQSDRYHWQRGIGPLAQRQTNEHFHSRQQQASVMGTAEFLDLCVQTGARPLLTINVPSGSPEEAAAWVRAVNVDGLLSPRTGERLPAVHEWEIGNEPYLKDEAQPTLTLEPEAFAAKADACIRAMRAVDPNLRIGLPLSTDTRNGIPVVHFPRWSERVLAHLHERVDVACVHNAYLPFAYDRLDDPEAVYWATMAGTRTVARDLDALHALLARVRPDLKALPVALTEYHAIFSLGRGATDEWTGSPLAALYVADLLRVLAGRPDVIHADLWSLSGNWRFGAIHSEGWLRPAGQVLQMLAPVLQGQLLDTSRQSESTATPAAGVVAAEPDLPLIETLATRAGTGASTVWRVLLLNKHRSRAATGSVDLQGVQARTGALRLLHAPDPLRSEDTRDLMVRTQVDLTPALIANGTTRFHVSLPAASVAVLEITAS